MYTGVYGDATAAIVVPPPPVGETNPSLKNIVAIKQNKSTTKNG